MLTMLKFLTFLTFLTKQLQFWNRFQIFLLFIMSGETYSILWIVVKIQKNAGFFHKAQKEWTNTRRLWYRWQGRHRGAFLQVWGLRGGDPPDPVRASQGTGGEDTFWPQSARDAGLG